MTKIDGSDGLTFGDVGKLLFPGQRINSTNGGWPSKDGTVYTIRCGAKIAALVVKDDGWYLKEPMSELSKTDVEYLNGPSRPLRGR